MLCFKKNKKYFKIYLENLKDEIEKEIVSDLLIKNYKLHKKDQFDSKKFFELFVIKKIENQFCEYSVIDICGQNLMTLMIPAYLMKLYRETLEQQVNEQKEE